MEYKALTNKRGQSVKERIEEEFEYINMIQDIDQRKALACKALGAADMAVEFGLITYKEWSRFVSLFFEI